MGGGASASGDPKSLPLTGQSLTSSGRSSARTPRRVAPTLGASSPGLLIDTTPFILRTASSRRGIVKAGARPQGAAEASTHSMPKGSAKAQPGASLWQARRDAAVRVRAAVHERAQADRSATDEARIRGAKLARLLRTVPSVRPEPPLPPAVQFGWPFRCDSGFETPSQVHRNIFLGDMDDARAAGSLHALGITHVLNMARTVRCYHPDEFMYTHIEIDDSPRQDIRPHFAEAFAAIDEAARSDRGILVHCVAGISRSVTAVVAWLVEREGSTLACALARVRRLRPIIDPNPGFRLALAEHEIAVRGSSSVADGTDDFWDFSPWNELRVRAKRDPPPPPLPCPAACARKSLVCLAGCTCIEVFPSCD